MNVSSTVKAERTTKRKTSNYSFPKEMKNPSESLFQFQWPGCQLSLL